MRGGEGGAAWRLYTARAGHRWCRVVLRGQGVALFFGDMPSRLVGPRRGRAFFIYDAQLVHLGATTEVPC